MTLNRLLLFDIDGTLLHAGGTGRRAFSKAFEKHFGVIDAYEGVVARGRTDPGLIQEIAEKTLSRRLEQDEYGQLRESYIDFFQCEIQRSDNFRLMPGVPDLIQELYSRERCSLGIETGNFRDTARIKLKHGELDQYFGSGGFACDSTDRSEIIHTAIQRAEESSGTRYEKIIVIGDASQDIEAAKENNATALLVLTGGIQPDDPVTRIADHVTEDLSETEQIIEFLLTC